MARILVIDDEELARFTMREILEAAGHTVDEAEDGDVGISKFEANPTDVIVTDIIMPKKEGVQTIIELKRDHPEVKIIAVSGGGRTRNMDFLKLAEEFGADKILAKPFADDDLLAAVKEVLLSKIVLLD